VNWSSVIDDRPRHRGVVLGSLIQQAATASSGMFVAANKWQFVAVVRTAS
jgi:hypothetical protein